MTTAIQIVDEVSLISTFLRLGPLSVGDTLEFVFAGFNSETTVGTMNLENLSSGNGIEVNGVVNFSSVPEPTSLLMFGATALIGLKRRRKTSRA
jgi:hypothetical protein